MAETILREDFREQVKQAFVEVAPLYAAQPAIEQWIREHGFVFVGTPPEFNYRVQESSEGRNGILWGGEYKTYEEVVIVLLDEILRRATEGIPTNG